MSPQVALDMLPTDLRHCLAKSLNLVAAEPMLDFSGPQARDVLARTQVLVTSWGCPRVDAEVLDAAPQLRAVIHAAGSVKNHLDNAVWDRGIVVSSAADASVKPVVDFTMAAVVFAAKRALPLAREYTTDWHHRGQRPLLGTHGRRVGVFGASRIGRSAIRRLVESGFQVAVSDPFLTPAGARGLGAELVELDDLCQTCDIVTRTRRASPRPGARSTHAASHCCGRARFLSTRRAAP